MIKWEERQGVIDDLQRIGENPNDLGVLAKALLLLLDPPLPGKRYEPATVGEFDYPTKDSGTGPR